MLELGMETVSCLVFFMSLEFFKSLDHLLSWALNTRFRCYDNAPWYPYNTIRPPKQGTGDVSFKNGDFLSGQSIWSLLVLVPENSIFCFDDTSNVLKFGSFVFNFLHKAR